MKERKKERKRICKGRERERASLACARDGALLNTFCAGRLEPCSSCWYSRRTTVTTSSLLAFSGAGLGWVGFALLCFAFFFWSAKTAWRPLAFLLSAEWTSFASSTVSGEVGSSASGGGL